jgi:hypothetical protein
MDLQLDILAIEPFYGGPRKAMLDTLFRCSEHRWSLLKLPPRRMERRLTAAAHWFAEHLTLHGPGNIDLILASDALNLADFVRLLPGLAGKPTVVYFHTNQLLPSNPDETAPIAPTPPAVLANLASAATAQEIWFNSAYHQRSFMERTRALLARQEQQVAGDPVADLEEKSRLMPPPTDLHLAQHVQTASSIQRDKRTLFIDTHDADCQILNATLATLERRKEPFQIITVGPARGLSNQWPRAIVPDDNDFAIVQGMLKSGAFITLRRNALWDNRLLLALSAGCWPIVPDAGVYRDLIPALLNERCLFDGTPGHLAFTIQDFWELQLPDGHAEAIQSILQPVNAETATRGIDERLVELAIAGKIA